MHSKCSLCCNNFITELGVQMSVSEGFVTHSFFFFFLFWLPLQIFLFCTYRVLYILYMMSSLGNDKARGPREKALAPATHTSQPQKQIQVSNRSWQQEPESPFVKDSSCLCCTSPRYIDIICWFLSCRLLLSKSDLPRWSMTRTMRTLRTKWTR